MTPEQPDRQVTNPDNPLAVELLPCPAGHGGCTVQRGSMDNRIVWDVFCGVPACRWVISAETKAEAIAAWNQRDLTRTTPSVAEAVERCAEIAEAAADDDSDANSPYDNGAGASGYRQACRAIEQSIRDYARTLTPEDAPATGEAR